MFAMSYLFLILGAAIPLARTFLSARGSDQVAFLHRLYRDQAYVLAAVLGIICFESALRISLENYWFTELGQSHRYWLSLEYHAEIFSAIFLLVGLFVASNLRLLCRPFWTIPRSAPWLAAFLFSGAAAPLRNMKKPPATTTMPPTTASTTRTPPPSRRGSSKLFFLAGALRRWWSSASSLRRRPIRGSSSRSSFRSSRAPRLAAGAGYRALEYREEVTHNLPR